MDKMRMESPDLTQRNIEAIGALFPNCITETRGADGAIRRAINFDMLHQMLTDDVISGDEAYEFTWVGKKASIVEASRTIRKTLRPCLTESVKWDSTHNLYIEGDNLDILKLLQESYLGRIKLIYIDPPYNTGHDLIYNDSFARSVEEEETQMGMFDDETENRLFENTESNGRFHSDWCSMLYSRLLVSRNLLTDDGLIFISIGDAELHNLKKMADEVFGAANFIAQINIITGANQSGDGVLIQKNVEYCLVYAKSIDSCKIIRVDKTEESWRNLNDAPTPLETRLDMGYTIYYHPNTKDMIPKMDYDKDAVASDDEAAVYHDDQTLVSKGYIPVRPGRRNGKLHRWRWGIDTFLERKSEIQIFYTAGKYVPKFQQQGFNAPKNTQSFAGGTNDLKKLFGDQTPFDYPKGLSFMHYICSIALDKDDIALDYFSGSATTAHAVMQLNAEDGGHRSFIMVQWPEKCAENSAAYKAGYRTICDVGKERIRRAGESILKEAGLLARDLDVGFRVLKLDDTNMKPVYYSAGEYDQTMLSGMESNIWEDRTDLDLLFGCLLEWALPLTLAYASETISGCTVHTYNYGDLIACFDNNVPEAVIQEIASRHPLRVVFRDSSFASSPERINVEEIFKLLSPNTSVKVL